MLAIETDVRRAAAGPSLAEMMLARGAQLPTVALRTVEQAVTKAERVQQAEDAAVTETAECTNHACAHAAPGSPCDCWTCFGAGHGWIIARAQDAARATAQARIDRSGGIENVLRTARAIAPADDPTPHRVPGLAAIQFDADGWPID